MKSKKAMATPARLGFFLVALPLLLAVGPNACPIDVQCNDVLDVDHGQYRLSGDLECPFDIATPFAAVTITGEGVHFNLAGYTITRDDGTGEFLSRGIEVRSANVHINGGSVVGFDCPDLPDRRNCAAIRLFDAPGVLINGMSLKNNVVGIIESTSGNADGARIHGNDITGNQRQGIGLFGSAEGAWITDNDLSDTGGFSFGGQGYIGSSDGVSLIGNVANRCAASGILLFGDVDFPPAQRNTVRDNTTLDNARSGIALFGETESFRPSDNLIQSNTSFGNASKDLTEVTAGPVFPVDCLNTWKDNDFDVAGQDCIE